MYQQKVNEFLIYCFPHELNEMSNCRSKNSFDFQVSTDDAKNTSFHKTDRSGDYQTTPDWPFLRIQASNLGQWSAPWTQEPINYAIFLGHFFGILQQSNYINTVLSLLAK